MQVTRPRLFMLAFITAFLIANVILTRNLFTAPFPGLNDFMSRWEGARSYWVDGLNPYGEEASLNIQERIYGRPVREGEDPGYFAYPFYTVFLVWPLVYLPYSWASAIWMVLLEVCLIGALFLLLDLFEWRPKPWLLAALMVWMLIAYFPSRGLILGQPGHVIYFFEVATLWALVKGHDRLAGVTLALSTLKPQMGFLIVPFLLLWGLRGRRWWFLGSFGVVFGVLMAASFVLQPSWLREWLGQVSVYTSYTALGSPVWIVMRYYLGLGDIGEWAVNLVFYALMLWAWYEVLFRRKQELFLWTAVLTLTVTHLVATRTATPHFVVFIIPMIFYFRELIRYDRRRGGWWVAVILVLLFLIPWTHSLLTVKAKFEHPTMYLPAPFGVLLLLWFTRRLWWKALPNAGRAGDEKAVSLL